MNYNFSSSPGPLLHQLQSLHLSGQSTSPLPQQQTLSPIDLRPLATPHHQSRSCPSLLAPLPETEADPSYNGNPPPQVRAQSSPSPKVSKGGRRSPPQVSDGVALPRGFPEYQRGPYTYTDSTGALRNLEESQYLCACGVALAISSWAKNGRTHEKSKSHLKALNLEKEDGHVCPGCGKNDMRIDSLRRHVEKGGTRGKCKGISLAHLPVRAKSKKGLAHTKVRTPVPTNAALEESVSPPSHFSTLPTILRDPRSPGTDATRGSGLDARVAAAVSNPSLAPSPYVTSIHLPDLRLRVNTTVPRPDKSALSPISSSRDRYASPLPRSRPTASPRSCRSPFGGTRELFSSPLSGPPSLLLDTPASRNQSLWSPNTPFTPMLAFGASPNSFQTLPSLEDDDLLPPLKNLPESVDESAPSVFVQGLGLEDPPYPPFNAIDQHWDYSQAASPSPYGNPIALPVQPPQTSSIPTPQIQLQDVQTFHPQPSDPFRKLAPVRLHYGNFQGSQGWTASQSNEASSSSGYYHAQRTEYLPPGFLQNLPAYNFPEAPAPVVTQMAAPAMPSAAPSDYTAFQRERPPHHEFDIYDMTMDEHLQMQINGI